MNCNFYVHTSNLYIVIKVCTTRLLKHFKPNIILYICTPNKKNCENNWDHKFEHRNISFDTLILTVIDSKSII